MSSNTESHEGEQSGFSTKYPSVALEAISMRDCTESEELGISSFRQDSVRVWKEAQTLLQLLTADRTLERSREEDEAFTAQEDTSGHTNKTTLTPIIARLKVKSLISTICNQKTQITLFMIHLES